MKYIGLDAILVLIILLGGPASCQDLGSSPSSTWNDLPDDYAALGYIIEWEQNQIIQVPIDRTGSRSSISSSNPLYINVNGVDYALVSVLYADSPDCPPDAAGSDLPQEIDIDLQSLGLKNVEMVYMGTQSAWSPDLPNGVKVGEVIFDYDDGGPSSTLDLIMGENIAEWSWERPELNPSHSMPQIIWSRSTTLGSSQEYMGHTYAASIRLDATRTLSRIRLNVVDANSLLPYRNPPSTWIGVAIMALTLEGEYGRLRSPSDIVGEWDWFTGRILKIEPDGTCLGETNSGTWELTDASKRLYTIRWDKGGYIDTLTLSSDGEVLDGYNQYGTHVSGRKIIAT